MAWHMIYRKPEFCNSWPWSHYTNTLLEMAEFAKDLGSEYEYRVFEEVDLSDFEERVEDYGVEL